MAAPPVPRREAPSSPEEAAAVMRSAGVHQSPVRIEGGGTKSGWGRVTEPADVELSTQGLDQVIEHNGADLTAVLQAGVPLARAQAVFAEAGQRIAVDPPLGAGDAATLGGLIATGDTGPLRHRYAAPRDLIVGVTFALSDGTIAKAGGKVIKNVAGYDLAKLFTGSFGTLGLILEVIMRLHPLPPGTATATAATDDADALARAASAVCHSPFEAESVDVAWSDGHGEVLARFGGVTPDAPAKRTVDLMEEAGLDAGLVEDDDDDIWERQRNRQRSTDGAVVRVSGLPSELPNVLRAAQAVGASLVGRAGLGLSWLTLQGEDAGELVSTVEELRRRLTPFACVVLDAPVQVREKVDVWGDDNAVTLLRRIKARFDPAGVCNPGIFVGGI
jgi:glycolate oxidase FAD binding subunit